MKNGFWNSKKVEITTSANDRGQTAFKMAAACLISLPGEAWPLVRKAQIEAADNLAELMDEARDDLNKARNVLERWNARSVNYFNINLRTANWSEITEEKFVKLTSETERFITGYMTMADRLEYALRRAEKLKMWVFNKEMNILEDARAAIEIWMDQMKKLREWQNKEFGQV